MLIARSKLTVNRGASGDSAGGVIEYSDVVVGVDEVRIVP